MIGYLKKRLGITELRKDTEEAVVELAKLIKKNQEEIKNLKRNQR